MVGALLPRERIALAVLIGCLFLMPGVTPRATILPYGFLWAAPALAALAVRPAAARRLLAWMLAGAWFAALGAPGWGGVALAAAFGVSWLAALGATHFVFTGESYGLGGAWPILRLLRAVAGVLPPAALAGAGGLWVWRALGPSRWPAPGTPRGLDRPEQHWAWERIGAYDLLDLIWRGAVTMLMVFVAFVILLYMRKRWLQMRGGGHPPEILPGQAARLEYEALPAPPPPPRLPGRRGLVAGLWGRWEEAMRLAAPPRAPGETAAQFAARLDRPAAGEIQQITELLERAHYGPREPGPEDLARMRRLVEAERSRVSLERGIPFDPLDENRMEGDRRVKGEE